MRLPSPVQHQFSLIPEANFERSTFNRSHGLKTTFDSGFLVPIYVDEVLPGDTFKLTHTAFARLATPIKPIMDNLYLDTFFFYVPLRLLWDHFVNFQGEQADPDDTTDYTTPMMNAPNPGGWDVHSLGDYLGIPIYKAGLRHSSLFCRAYNLIYQEWFRDENLCDEVPIHKGDTDDPAADYVLKKRCKRHDYFTSCLPWPQKGDDILLPLGDIAPITGIGKASSTFDGVMRNVYESGQTVGTVTYNDSALIGPGADNQFFIKRQGATGYPAIYADLSAATSATINSIREAFQLQRLLERDARGGSRYREILKAHWGVDCPDYRLQRPEYLGGGSKLINVSPVVQTSASGATGTKQGNLAAFGTVCTRTGFVKSFVEHGIILGIANVRADLTYSQGLHRMFSRSTRYDYYMPVLAHLGEQAVLNKEIYCNLDTHDDEVFGYQERWAEYRYKPSQITGKFRSAASGSLDLWHLSQTFSSLPALGQTFIEENLPLQRVLAVTSPEPEIIYDSYNDLKCTRCMPVYSVPGLIDHF